MTAMWQGCRLKKKEMGELLAELTPPTRLKEKWYSPDYNDEGWEERDLLDPWPGSGSVWLRKTINIPLVWREKRQPSFGDTG